jgi:hypothetical protein
MGALVASIHDFFGTKGLAGGEKVVDGRPESGHDDRA